MEKKWIQAGEKSGDISKGGLHRSLDIPAGEKIPAAKIEAATHSDNPRTRRQADLAKTFSHIRTGKTADFAHHPEGRPTAHSGV